MSHWGVKVSGLLVGVSAIAGCVDSTAPDRSTVPTAPADLAATRQVPPRGADALFLSLAKQIPGFAGITADRSGKLMVHMKRSDAGVAPRVADIAGQVRSLVGPAIGNRLRSATFEVQDAKYDYLQLQGWKDRLSNIFRTRGVTFVDIDESANRVRIGLAPGNSSATVQQALKQAGVPIEAVVISPSSPIKAVKTLNQRFRPMPAGVEIAFPLPSMPGFAGICSLGFNATLASRPGQVFFVTASHCSDIQGGVEGTRYFQPFSDLNNANNRIATEFKDPQYGNPGGLCVYAGARCRLSDALLARYRSSSLPELGKIARTTFALQRIGSLEIDPQQPRWNIATEFGFPFEGETINKVGRSSGWTFGPVILTCVDVGQSGSDIVKLCQDFAISGVRGGDSGSPIFERLGGNDVALTGVLWGGGTLDGAPVIVFSAMENIEQELGQLNTSAEPALASVK